MPLVKIEIEKGFDQPYKEAILEGIHQALVDCIRIPASDRRQRIYELDPQDFIHTGKSKQFTLVEITMFPGRSKEARKALYRAIVDHLATNPGIPPSDIMIVIHEPPLHNWGIRGGFPADEIDPGFEIKV